jgi:hypothetical protein
LQEPAVSLFTLGTQLPGDDLDLWRVDLARNVKDAAWMLVSLVILGRLRTHRTPAGPAF